MTGEDGDETRGGAVAVVQVGTGEVLALASYPTYDLSTFRQSSIYAALYNDPAAPSQTRATNGTYVPGSTIKPLTAVAALEKGIITPTQEIYSPSQVGLSQRTPPTAAPTARRQSRSHQCDGGHHQVLQLLLRGDGIPNGHGHLPGVSAGPSAWESTPALRLVITPVPCPAMRRATTRPPGPPSARPTSSTHPSSLPTTSPHWPPADSTARPTC